MAKEYKPSTELQTKLDLFEGLDKAYKAQYDAFYQKNAAELDSLEDLREKRNIALDELKRASRDEVGALDITQYKSVRVGRLSVTKPETKFFIPEAFVATADQLGLYDRLVEKGAIIEKIEVPYKEAKAALEELKQVDNFLHCEDGKELTPTVTGPKNIPPFGAEYKEK